jgi:nucleoside-diphosphate-sugar epimerase
MVRETVAVTGAAGFLGRRLVERLAADGAPVVALDLRAPDGVVLDAVVDVRDRSTVEDALRRHQVGVVVHAAAIVGVAAVERDPVAAASVNVVGGMSVIEASLSAGVRRVVDLSSEEVYGAAVGGLLVEGRPLTPVSAYGVHKAAVEGYAATRPGLEYAAARLSWIYGAGFPRSRPPQPWIDDAAQGRLSEAGPGADHLVDLLHLDDAVSAIAALVAADRLEHAAYNVGSGRAVSLGDVASALRRLEPGWAGGPTPGELPGIAQRSALSIERIREELGWTPDLSLEEGLRRTLHGR